MSKLLNKDNRIEENSNHISQLAASIAGGGDDLGDHTATEDLKMGAFDITMDALSTVDGVDISARDHAKYTDGEAVTAMGVKGDANPLHHDQSTPIPENYISPLYFMGNNGYVRGAWAYTVAHSDANAYTASSFIVPETRSDWKITVVHWSDTAARTDNALYYAGEFVDGEAWAWGVANGVAMNMVNTAASRFYFTTTIEYTLTKDHIFMFQHNKTNNAGTGILSIYGVYLWHD